MKHPEKQEPVGVVLRTSIAGTPMRDSSGVEWYKQIPEGAKLYTSPPRKEWVGLTDEELFELWVKSPAEADDRFAFARAVEAKLKEKNYGFTLIQY